MWLSKHWENYLSVQKYLPSSLVQDEKAGFQVDFEIFNSTLLPLGRIEGRFMSKVCKVLKFPIANRLHSVQTYKQEILFNPVK